MALKEGDRIKLTGKAWGYRNRNREVYARVTFVDGGFAKLDEQVITSSGLVMKGYEFEIANED